MDWKALVFRVGAVALTSPIGLLLKNGWQSPGQYKLQFSIFLFLWVLGVAALILVWKKFPVDSGRGVFRILFLCSFLIVPPFNLARSLLTREFRVMLLPGEGVRLNPDLFSPIFGGWYQRAGSRYALGKHCEKSAALENKTRANAEADVLEPYAAMEEKRMNQRGIILTAGERRFFDNTALLLDAYLKRLTESRNTADWPVIFRGYCRLMAGRSYASPASPDVARILTLDKLELQLRPDWRGINRRTATFVFSGQLQQNISALAAETEEGIITASWWQSAALESDRSGNKVMLPADPGFSPRYDAPTVEYIPAAGETGGGYLDSGWFNERNEWEQLRQPIRVRSGEFDAVQSRNFYLTELTVLRHGSGWFVTGPAAFLGLMLILLPLSRRDA